MDFPPSRDFDAWNDPEFSPEWVVPDKSANLSDPSSAENDSSGRSELRSRWRTRSLLIAFLVIWLELLLDPTVGRLVFDAAVGFGTTLAVLALALGLGLLGSGLFAMGDRVLAWLRAGSHWPEDGF